MKVTVAYALLERQTLVTLDLPEDSLLETAIRQSGILTLYPEIDLAVNLVGVRGKVRPLSTRLKAGDRVEIYRPRQADPKEARRQRAGKGGGL